MAPDGEQFEDYRLEKGLSADEKLWPYQVVKFEKKSILSQQAWFWTKCSAKNNDSNR